MDEAQFLVVTDAPVHHRSRAFVLACLLGACAWADAGEVLDRLRNIDLNDYALGVAISTSETPYAGAEQSTIAYPYLTSFSDSSLNDEWLFIRDGDLGIRRVIENGWEYGLSGTVRTLGLGNSDSPRRPGLESRKWTAEAGPILAYRGWPVHIDLKAHFDLLGRHNGLVGEVGLSMPFAWDRSYIVPGIGVIYYDRDFVDYYYGVSQNEELVSRPAYVGDTALNTSATVRFGYALSKKWLLSGSVDIEYLDASISDSPIVDKSRLWSARLGLAYNDDIFNPARMGWEDRASSRSLFRIGAFRATADTVLTHNSSNGAIGTELDLEDELGLEDEQTVLQIGAVFRLSDYHRIEFGYYGISRDGETTISSDVNVADRSFGAGQTLQSQFESDVLWVGYGYSLLKDPQKELGFVAGLHYTKSRGTILSEATGEQTISSIETPLPVIGLFGSVSIDNDWSVELRAQVFRLDYDRYEGSLNFASLNLQRRFGESFSIGVAYNLYKMKLTSSDDSLTGSLSIRYNGPSIFVAARF
ncbi:MAG: MipA/OmpV family protein [Woeseiaceae bacterium]